MSSSILDLHPPLDLLRHRPAKFEVQVYQSDLETPYGIQLTDKIRFRVWKTADAASQVTCDNSAASANGSTVAIDTRGATGTTPAKATIVLTATDVDQFASTDTVYWEAAVLVAAESNNPYVFERGQFTVIDNANA